jgi:multiple sugar transport system permease protein
MLRPTTFFVMVMLTIDCFRIFDLVQVMTQGGPGRATTVLVHQLYHSAFVRFNFGYASSIALVLFFMVIGVTVIQFLVGKRYEGG